MRKLIFTSLSASEPLPARRRNRAQEQQPALLRVRLLEVPSVRSLGALPAPQSLLLAGRLAQACATFRTAEGNSSMTVLAGRSSDDALRDLAQAPGLTSAARQSWAAGY